MSDSKKPDPVMDPRPDGMILDQDLRAMHMENVNWRGGTINDINFSRGVIMDSNLSNVTIKGCELNEDTMINGVPVLAAMRAYRAAQE